MICRVRFRRRRPGSRNRPSEQASGPKTCSDSWFGLRWWLQAAKVPSSGPGAETNKEQRKRTTHEGLHTNATRGVSRLSPSRVNIVCVCVCVCMCVCV